MRTESTLEKSMSVMVQSMEAMVLCLVAEPTPMKASRSGPSRRSGHWLGLGLGLGLGLALTLTLQEERPLRGKRAAS